MVSQNQLLLLKQYTYAYTAIPELPIIQQFIFIANFNVVAFYIVLKRAQNDGWNVIGYFPAQGRFGRTNLLYISNGKTNNVPL